MTAAACLTLAAVHLPVWWRNREARASIAFSVAAMCTAVFAFCELRMLHAQTPGAYAVALKWAHLPVTMLAVALAAFIHFYLDAGRVWLAVTAIALQVVSLPFNFMTGQNLNYQEVTVFGASLIWANTCPSR